MNEYSQYIHSGSIDTSNAISKSVSGTPLVIEKSDNLLQGSLLIGSSKADGDVFGKLGYIEVGITDGSKYLGF